MSDDIIRNINIELKLGLWHIEKALRCPEMDSQDMRCIHTISAAKDHIQEFLRCGIPSSIDNHRLFAHYGLANCGWDPMRSKFPGIEGLRGKDDHKLDLQWGNIRSGPESGGFFESPNKGVKPAAEFLKYKICNVNCNSLSQWEQHVKGHQHQARVVGEDPQRMKLTYLSERNNIFSVKMVHKAGKFYPSSYEKADCNPPKGRRWKTKEAEIWKRWLYGKRHCGTLMWCEFCDVTCNGNRQYLGHIKGKRHQMAVEQCKRMCK